MAVRRDWCLVWTVEWRACDEQVTRVDESGRNSPKHIFIPLTSESLSATRLPPAAAAGSSVHTESTAPAPQHQHRHHRGPDDNT